MLYVISCVSITIFTRWLWEFVSTYEETMSEMRKLQNTEDVIFK